MWFNTWASWGVKLLFSLGLRWWFRSTDEIGSTLWGLHSSSYPLELQASSHTICNPWLRPTLTHIYLSFIGSVSCLTNMIVFRSLTKAEMAHSGAEIRVPWHLHCNIILCILIQLWRILRRHEAPGQSLNNPFPSAPSSRPLSIWYWRHENFDLQEINPRIYMAESDFDAITDNGKLCNADGNIGSDEFCEIMTTEIRLVSYFLVKSQRSSANSN